MYLSNTAMMFVLFTATAWSGPLEKKQGITLPACLAFPDWDVCDIYLSISLGAEKTCGKKL